MDERRSSQRIPLKLLIDINGEGFLTTKDISRNGAFVVFDKGSQINIGKYPSIRIILYDGNSEKIIQGEGEFVNYRYIEPMGFGLKFTKIDNEYYTFYKNKIKTDK